MAFWIDAIDDQADPRPVEPIASFAYGHAGAVHAGWLRCCHHQDAVGQPQRRAADTCLGRLARQRIAANVEQYARKAAAQLGQQRVDEGRGVRQLGALFGMSDPAQQSRVRAE